MSTELATVEQAATDRIEAFTFGEPTPVLDRRQIMEYLECVQMDKWYEPPISWEGLSRSFRSAPHHSSPIYFKANVITSSFVPHKLLSRQTFRKFVLDYLVFGNSYIEDRTSILNQKMPMQHALAKYTRRGADLDNYWFVKSWQNEHEFKPGSVFHLVEPDINQEVYGLPEYLSSLNSAWLNEAATLFRRKYYENGSHAGFILYLSDTAQSQDDIDSVRQALKDSKGPGNFRNLFVHAPNGKKDGIQIIPISEVAAKDEMFNIKSVTRDDLLAAHRVPPQLMGIIPTNTSGFGDTKTAAEVFARNELDPLQSRFKELNDWFGDEVVRFDKYVIGD